MVKQVTQYGTATLIRLSDIVADDKLSTKEKVKQLRPLLKKANSDDKKEGLLAALTRLSTGRFAEHSVASLFVKAVTLDDLNDMVITALHKDPYAKEFVTFGLREIQKNVS